MTRISDSGKRRSFVPIALTTLVLAIALGGGAWAAKTIAEKGPNIEQSQTLTFSVDDASHELFSVGGSTFYARCGPADPGPEEGGIKRRFGVVTGPDGAVFAGADGSSMTLGPNDEEAFIIDEVGPTAVNAAHISFSFFDGGGASGGGSAALLADSPNGQCTVTAQIEG
jgi:hypothetical protein